MTTHLGKVVKPKDLLVFFTGADKDPLSGFEHWGKLTLESNVLAAASILCLGAGAVTGP